VIAPDDPRHGKTSGFHAGCRLICCRSARVFDAKRSKIERSQGRFRTENATGTHRKLRALMRIGWTSRHISEAAGWQTAEAVSEILKRTRVRIATRDAISDVYDRLSMTPGPSALNRRRAERAGWAPPLAWDDETIDDPNAEPNYGNPRELTRHGPEASVHPDDVEWLLDTGEHPVAIITRLGTNAKALDKVLRRRGRLDLVQRIAARRAVA
jgi:hypothetical protein